MNSPEQYAAQVPNYVTLAREDNKIAVLLDAGVADLFRKAMMEARANERSRIAENIEALTWSDETPASEVEVMNKITKKIRENLL
jgi:hypothetical protein